MKHQRGTTAIVIGGSMAGMLAARVLAEHFDQVLLLERDEYPLEPVPRTGVPQARHLHALLTRGHQIVEELFPGISEDWRWAGAEFLDIGRDFAWRTPKGWGVRFPSGIRMLAGSRPLIDFVVRRRLADVRNITAIESAVVTGLVSSEARDRVTGVAVRMWGGPVQQLAADLVVEASGRMSCAPEWLLALGYPPPRESEVNAHLGYATRLYRRSPEQTQRWKALFIQAAPPDQTRAGIAFPVEGDRWIVTVCGGGGDYAPVEEGPFLEFVRSLPDPQLYDLVRQSEPLGPIVGYRRMENRWRHYEDMERRPEGFVVLGDAACAFNPVYGQGLTIAALGALALRDCLRDSVRPGLPSRFQRRLAEVIRVPWTLATAEDVRYRGAEGAKPGMADRVMQWYVDQVMAVSTYDRRVRKALLRVFTMTHGPQVLFHPRVLGAVLASLLSLVGKRCLAGLSMPAARTAASSR
jgi:2-polyprenyl-6-methoxyphenol hydroxylase-like FAD-dependent oxidoreductase